MKRKSSGFFNNEKVFLESQLTSYWVGLAGQDASERERFVLIDKCIGSNLG